MYMSLPTMRKGAPQQGTTLLSTGVRGLSVRYEPFGESGSSSFIHADVPRVSSDGLVFLSLSREYLEAIGLKGIAPEVRGVQVSRDHVVLGFHCDPGRSATISIEITFDRPGLIAGELGLENGPQVKIMQCIAP